jgi:hypothetical protein
LFYSACIGFYRDPAASLYLYDPEPAASQACRTIGILFLTQEHFCTSNLLMSLAAKLKALLDISELPSHLDNLSCNKIRALSNV